MSPEPSTGGLDLVALHALILVARESSFARAARKSGTPRSTLRRRVEGLEQSVGGQLFKRAPTGLKLTERGQMLFDTGTQLVRSADALMKNVQHLSEYKPDRLLRCVMPMGPIYRLFGLLESFISEAESTTRYDVRLHSDPLSLIGQIQYHILVHYDEPSIQAEGWTHQHLFDIEERLFASETYLREHAAPTCVEDLQEHPVFIYRTPGDDPTMLPLWSRNFHKIMPRGILPDADALVKLASAHHGLIFLPDTGVAPPQGKQRLVPVLDELIGRKRGVWLSTPTHLFETEQLQAVITRTRRIAKRSPSISIPESRRPRA